MIFENGTREPLHGHNYRVQVKGETPQLKADMVFDFLDIKPIVREVCDALDHKLLIPKLNHQLRIDVQERNTVITTPEGDVFSVPSRDVLLLPIQNTSAELFAAYLSEEIRRILWQRHAFAFATLEVEVEETPGQSALYVHKELL